MVAIAAMPLPGYVVSEADENDHLDRSMVFKLTHPQKTYYLQTDNDQNALERYVEIFGNHVELNVPVFTLWA